MRLPATDRRIDGSSSSDAGTDAEETLEWEREGEKKG